MVKSRRRRHWGDRPELLRDVMLAQWPEVPADQKIKAHVFDVDGTLIDVSRVRWHVNLNDSRNRGFKDFNSFHEAAASEPPHAWVVDAINAVPEDEAAIVVTARKRMWENHTVWSLLLSGVTRLDHLFMRRDDDDRKDFLVKADILEMISRRFRIVRAWDDNPNVIALWESHGIPVVRVPGWEE